MLQAQALDIISSEVSQNSIVYQPVVLAAAAVSANLQTYLPLSEKLRDLPSSDHKLQIDFGPPHHTYGLGGSALSLLRCRALKGMHVIMLGPIVDMIDKRGGPSCPGNSPVDDLHQRQQQL